MDASDVELVSRYKETRRLHPLSRQGGVLEGIQKERALLSDLKSQADVVIDTTELTPRNLRLRIDDYFGDGQTSSFFVEVMSFGLSMACHWMLISLWMPAFCPTRSTCPSLSI